MNLAQNLRERARKYPDKTAYVFHGSGISYREVDLAEVKCW